MFYKFKNILLWALCLVLVCAISVPAFAATEYEANEDYDNGNTTVSAYGVISRYHTYGFISSESIITEPNVDIAVAYRYLDENFQLQSRSSTSHGVGVASVSVSNNSIAMYQMVDATYDFWAQVPTSYGWQEFAVDSVYLRF